MQYFTMILENFLRMSSKLWGNIHTQRPTQTYLSFVYAFLRSKVCTRPEGIVSTGALVPDILLLKVCTERVTPLSLQGLWDNVLCTAKGGTGLQRTLLLQAGRAQTYLSIKTTLLHFIGNRCPLSFPFIPHAPEEN